MSITFKLDALQVRSLQRRLDGVVRDIDKATVSGINDTVKQLRTQVKKEARKHFAAKAKYIMRRTWTQKAKRGKARGAVYFGTRHKLPLRAFPKRQTRKGVSVQVLKGGKRTMYGGAFIVKGQRKTETSRGPRYDVGVFRREGRDRLPIKRVDGINPYGLIKRTGIFPKLRTKAPRMLEKNIQKRIKLANMRRKQRANR